MTVHDVSITALASAVSSAAAAWVAMTSGDATIWAGVIVIVGPVIFTGIVQVISAWNNTKAAKATTAAAAVVVTAVEEQKEIGKKNADGIAAVHELVNGTNSELRAEVKEVRAELSTIREALAKEREAVIVKNEVIAAKSEELAVATSQLHAVPAAQPVPAGDLKVEITKVPPQPGIGGATG